MDPQPDIADVVIALSKPMLVPFFGTLTFCGAGLGLCHLYEKYDITNKTKMVYSHTKDSITELIDKYRS